MPSRNRGRVVRVDSVADLDRRLARGVRRLGSWRVHGLDLRGRVADLLERDVDGAAFLGCLLGPGDAESLRAAGALVMPTVTDVPVDVYRSSLYTADELYATPAGRPGPYADTLDARAYAWTQQAQTRDDSLAAALHDHAVDEALDSFLADGRRRVVGVMGGHAADRGTPGYADACRLGRLLGRSVTVATGGGPGAMEAANLGARFARADDDLAERALTVLAAAPTFAPSIDAWVAAARDVLAIDHEPVASLGVPTWHYGHEPPNLFATSIAKYVRNAEREAVLLQACDGGTVFLPGSAGTLQEVFQDGCENFYADEASLAPMVLVGRDHWTTRLPAWPLLQALADGTPMRDRVHLVDDVDAAADLVAEWVG